MNTQLIKAGAVAISLFGGGFVAGYFVSKKRVEKEYGEKLAKEIKDTKEFFKILYKKEEYDTPDEIVSVTFKPTDEQVRDEVIREYLNPEDEITIAISQEEYNENPRDHIQSEWTYYDKDDIVVDEQDQPVMNYHATLGDVDLSTAFEETSVDGTQLFFRNNILTLDVLVSLDYGSWNEKAVWEEEEKHLSHSYRKGKKVRKFRSDDA